MGGQCVRSATRALERRMQRSLAPEKVCAGRRLEGEPSLVLRLVTGVLLGRPLVSWACCPTRSSSSCVRLCLCRLFVFVCFGSFVCLWRLVVAFALAGRNHPGAWNFYFTWEFFSLFFERIFRAGKIPSTKQKKRSLLMARSVTTKR